MHYAIVALGNNTGMSAGEPTQGPTPGGQAAGKAHAGPSLAPLFV
jgi:hypothetical protein